MSDKNFFDKFSQSLSDLTAEPPTYKTLNLYKDIPLGLDSKKTTEFVLREMLKEDTGKNVLDSGSAYGRGYDRAQEIKNWEEIPYKNDDLEDRTVNLYPYLCDTLQYDHSLDKAFSKFAQRKENKDETWLDNMQNFINKKGFDYRCELTYYKETDLSKHLRYCLAETREGKEFIILQTHNGADIRGGYSVPHAFKFSFDSEYFLSQQSYD